MDYVGIGKRIRTQRLKKDLSQEELAVLMRVRDPGLWEEMRAAAGAVKRKVYDNRIVTFAPLYLSSKCVNNCVYCGLRGENEAVTRRVLTMDEVRAETEAASAMLPTQCDIGRATASPSLVSGASY